MGRGSRVSTPSNTPAAIAMACTIVHFNTGSVVSHRGQVLQYSKPLFLSASPLPFLCIPNSRSPNGISAGTRMSPMSVSMQPCRPSVSPSQAQVTHALRPAALFKPSPLHCFTGWATLSSRILVAECTSTGAGRSKRDSSQHCPSKS